ncbi:MAG: SLBB domain-containing protein [Dehalococcoidales bacterium]|nr:SLBB domain-containing protein [Dehalococcoidales bacterium]
MNKFETIVAEAKERQRQRRQATRVSVATGECGLAVGAGEVFEAIRFELRRRGIAGDVVEVGCDGMCHAAVLVDVERPGLPRVTYGGVTPDKVPWLVEQCLVHGQSARELAVGVWAPDPLDGIPPISSLPFWQGQRRILTQNLGLVDPFDVDDYIARGGYAALARALSEMTPEQVIDEVRLSGLTGRGGAYFPTGLKWAGCRRAAGLPRYLVVNAEEGEPGVFKDRHIMEADPHRLIEGTAIAAYAIGAEKGFIYINGEAAAAIRRVENALRQGRERNLLGQRILGTAFSFEPEIRIGAGGYVLGEASTMHASIEGERPSPRVKLVRSVESGVFDKPTVTNNVETIACVPAIVANGGAWHAGIGSAASKGTKLIALSGNVARPGLLEVPMGTTLRAIIEDMGGGVPEGRGLQAVLTGGPSGGLLPASLLDLPFEEGALEREGSILGAGGMIAIDDSNCVVDVVRLLTAYNQQESCAKCTPCREGTPRMLEALDRIAAGQADQQDVDDLLYLCELLGPTSLCGLGQTAPNPITSAWRHFREDFDAHIVEKRCPRGICPVSTRR